MNEKELEKCLETFRLRLYQLMNNHDMNQTDLAMAIDISQAAMNKTCKGDTMPRIYTLIAIAKYFNVSADWLLGLDK